MSIVQSILGRDRDIGYGILRKVKRQTLKDYVLSAATSRPASTPSLRRRPRMNQGDSGTTGNSLARRHRRQQALPRAERHRVAPDRAPLVPDLPARRYPEIATEIQQICERYNLAHNTGPLHRQLGSVAKKIFTMALPPGKQAHFSAVDEADGAVSAA